jgi:hypothetical protein
VQLGRQEPDQRRVGGAIDRWGLHPDPEGAVDDAVDAVGPAAGREANRETRQAT